MGSSRTPRVGTPLGTVPLLTAAQPCAQHPHKHNQGPNSAILGQLDPQTGSPSGDYASPALSILMGQILLSLGSQRGSKSFSPSWMWAQEFGVTTAVLSLGQGHTQCKCQLRQGMLLPPASPNWDVLEAALQPPPSHHRGRDRGVLNQSVPPCHAVCVHMHRGLHRCIYTMCALKSLPQPQAALHSGFAGVRTPRPCPEREQGEAGAGHVVSGLRGLHRPFRMGALGVSIEPAPEPAQSCRSGSSDRFMTNKRIKPSASLLRPCFPHSHELLPEGDWDAGCGHGVIPHSPALQLGSL